MTEAFLLYLMAAHGLPAHIYGLGDMFCGDYEQVAIACEKGVPTASGELLDPEQAQLALALPRNKKMPKGMSVWLKLEDGPCVRVALVDKTHERWMGQRFGDLTPAAVVALGGTPSKFWSAPVFICGKTLKQAT